MMHEMYRIHNYPCVCNTRVFIAVVTNACPMLTEKKVKEDEEEEEDENNNSSEMVVAVNGEW